MSQKTKQRISSVLQYLFVAIFITTNTMIGFMIPRLAKASIEAQVNDFSTVVPWPENGHNIIKRGDSTYELYRVLEVEAGIYAVEQGTNGQRPDINTELSLLFEAATLYKWNTSPVDIKYPDRMNGEVANPIHTLVYEQEVFENDNRDIVKCCGSAILNGNLHRLENKFI